MNNVDKLEIYFSLNLVRLMKWFNLLECNLGLALSFLMDFEDPKGKYTAIAKMSFDMKLKKFIRLVGDEKIESIGIDLESWTCRVNDARRIRNAYVHGYWSILPHNAGEAIELSLPPWFPMSEDIPIGRRLSINDIHEAADFMGKAFGEFMHIRRQLGI